MDNITRLSLALGRQHAVAALLALLADGPMGATDLSARIHGYAGSGIAIARHLEKSGLVDIQATEGVAGKNAYQINLTKIGKRVAQAIEPLPALMG